MPTYNTKLKRAKNGKFPKYVGRNAKGTKMKFDLGYDRDEAESRLRVIQALWNDLELRFLPGQQAYWDDKTLKAAKAVAKGESPKIPKRDFESPENYVIRLAELSKASEQKVDPADHALYQAGLHDMRSAMNGERIRLSAAIGIESATGQTLGEALTGFRSYVENEMTLPNGNIQPWGKTRLDQQDSIRAYLENEAIAKQDFTALDLGELSLSKCDEIYQVFRSRPLTIRTNFRTRMTPSSAGNLIKELGNFFDWMDGSDDFDWYIPSRFHSIKKKTEPLTGTEKYDRQLAKRASIIPDEHLTILYETAIPEERLLLLLGMNCAFGAAEVGQLRTTFLDLSKAEIEGIRFKSGGETKHKLWCATNDGLVWWLEERKSISVADPLDEDIVFLTSRGRPLWKYTQQGNSSDGVSNRWYRLIDRV